MVFPKVRLHLCLGSVLTALTAMTVGCAGTGGKGASPFVLIAGKKIGRIELVPDEEGGFTRKSRDSANFDNQYLHTRPRLGFKFPGEDIAFMKVYDGDKLLKTCDEGSYARAGSLGGGGGNWSPGPNGQMSFHATGGGGKQEVYAIKYNLECEIPPLKDGMTVDIHDGEGLLSRYKVVLPSP